jgi:hypothetical protein
MRALANLLSGMLAFAFACSCGDPDEPAGETDAPLTVPDFIDVDVCAHLVRDEADGLGPLEQCSSCCEAAAYADSGFINEDRCTCGNLPDSDGDSVCVDQFDTSDACSQCCDANSYLVNSWIGGNACTCDRRVDLQSCAQSGADGSACERCCLEQGYLETSYSTFDTPKCRCFGK